MKLYNHYLITMFNLKLNWKDCKTNSEDDYYLKSRFELFEKYTFPSVKSQSNINFKWLVLFSASTDKKYIEHYINRYCLEFKNFIPIFIDDKEANNFRKIVLDYINKDNDKIYTITTRCDNDDIIHKDFISEIQSCVNNNETNELIISFSDGYQYEEKSRILRKYKFPTNHFTSLISNYNDKTIYDFLHMDIMDSATCYFINGKRMWIEVIHENNLMNCMGGIKFSDYIKKYDLTYQFNVCLKSEFSIFSLFFYYIKFIMAKIIKKRKRIFFFFFRKLKYRDI